MGNETEQAGETRRIASMFFGEFLAVYDVCEAFSMLFYGCVSSVGAVVAEGAHTKT